MSFKTNPIRLICLVFAIVSLNIVAFGDTIRLKDGSIFKGKIIAFSGGRFTLAIGDGSRRRELTLSAAEIESIEFDDPQVRPTAIPVADRTASTNQRYEEPVETVDDDKPQVVQASTRSVPPVLPPVVGTSTPVKTPVRPATTKTVTASTPVTPVQLSVNVLADDTANGWTNSGWVVKAGQKIRITGTGEVSIGGGKKATPAGLYDVADDGKLLKNVPTAALIAVIGDDNNDFIYVGSEREFTATRDGSLFLGLNEGTLSDNSGSFSVKIEISAGGE